MCWYRVLNMDAVITNLSRLTYSFAISTHPYQNRKSQLPPVCIYKIYMGPYLHCCWTLFVDVCIACSNLCSPNRPWSVQRSRDKVALQPRTRSLSTVCVRWMRRKRQQVRYPQRMWRSLLCHRLVAQTMHYVAPFKDHLFKGIRYKQYSLNFF